MNFPLSYFRDLNGLRTASNFFLIAGPCAIEDETSPMEIAAELKSLCAELNIPYIFKASYKKANRSRLDSFMGIGDERAIRVLSKIKNDLEIPVLTDVHTVDEVDALKEAVDVLQIPAFLCRQTELIIKAAQSGKIVNIKKGQFLAAESMKFAAEKVTKSGNEQVWLTERGSSFGLDNLVVDFRGIPTMQALGFPVVMDCTHSIQRPNQSSGITGGTPESIETIAKAAIAVGADGLFIETHPNPQMAKSDGANMLPLEQMKPLLQKLLRLRNSIQ